MGGSISKKSVGPVKLLTLLACMPGLGGPITTTNVGWVDGRGRQKTERPSWFGGGVLLDVYRKMTLKPDSWLQQHVKYNCTTIRAPGTTMETPPPTTTITAVASLSPHTPACVWAVGHFVCPSPFCEPRRPCALALSFSYHCGSGEPPYGAIKKRKTLLEFWLGCG